MRCSCARNSRRCSGEGEEEIRGGGEGGAFRGRASWSIRPAAASVLADLLVRVVMKVTRPPRPGPPRPRTPPKSRAWVARGDRAREPPRREPRSTPCTCFAASRARICFLPRTPCTCFAASRARRCPSPRTPCTGVAPSRARRCLSPGTPCRDTLPDSCRARTSDRSPSPRPLAAASRGPAPWRSARSIVTTLRRALPPGLPPAHS